MTDADVDGSHIRTLLLTFFYRHLPALIENHYIYIARPPLYRVTRKKVKRYIHSEKEMDDYLLKLGTSDVSIRLLGHNEKLDTEQVAVLLQAIRDVEIFIASLERKGIPFREFLLLKDEQGRLPQFQIKIADEQRLVFSEEEFAEVKKDHEEMQRGLHERTLAAIPQEEQTEEMRRFISKSLPFTELFQVSELQLLKERLAQFEFALDNYLTANGKLFDIVDEEGKETPIFTLKEGIEFFRANGRKGIEIQRYKGLGEMNADQLCETTMDPEKRTLVQVTIPDAVAADHMFTMLMGEDVPPRRAFIEQHALSVKNLDI
jgi:DNA gyrase subunit B